MAVARPLHAAAIVVVKAGMLTTVQERGPLGIPVPRRAGRRSDGSGVASAGERAGRQRPRRGAARSDAAGPGTGVRGRAAGRGRRRRLRAVARRAPGAVARAVHGRGRIASPVRRATTWGRAYLAVSGGITIEPVLGSRSTHLVSGMGGVGGRAVLAGDRLPLGDPSLPQGMALAPQDAIIALPIVTRPSACWRGRSRTISRRTRSPSCSRRRHVIAQNSDRMGFRLEGPRLTHARGADIISDATPLGVLQVPASGQPILLMADRQTTGGYPKIATVIAADLASPVSWRLPTRSRSRCARRPTR